MPADGSKPAQLLLKTERSAWATSWSPDGRFLVYTQLGPAEDRYRLWVLPLRGEAKPFALSATHFDDVNVNVSAKLSPDGRWLAYSSNETGRYEIYVQEFMAEAGGELLGGKTILSKEGGRSPMWRNDGKELWFIADDLATVMAVSIVPGRAFQAGVPHAVFRLPSDRVRSTTPGSAVNLAHSGDLKRFLVSLPVDQPPSPTFTVLVNWASAVKPTSK
jgi:hypothetical protein